jgi:hypothetical protein
MISTYLKPDSNNAGHETGQASPYMHRGRLDVKVSVWNRSTTIPYNSSEA